MQSLKIFSLFISAAIITSCGNHSSSQKKDADSNLKLAIDTNKLKKDIEDIGSALSKPVPDTTKLKATGADVLSTTATVLSDTGIASLGDKNDPHVKAAQDAFKKMRNAMGITPQSLDSIKKAAATLNDKKQNQ